MSTYDTTIASLLKRITASKPGDSAEAIRALCEGVSLLEQAKIYAMSTVATGDQEVAVVMSQGDGILN